MFGKRRKLTQSEREKLIPCFLSLRILLVQINILAYLHILTTVEKACHPFPIIDSNALCGVKNLLLNDNQISEIRPDAFNYLKDLKELDLSGNRLTNLHSDTFRNFPNLEKLDLSRNQLTRIDKNLFKYQTKLEELRLEANQIVEIHPDAFKHLVSLKVLLLSENRLKRIDARWFQSLFQLEVLNLNNNKITEITGNDTAAFLNTRNLLNLLILTENNSSNFSSLFVENDYTIRKFPFVKND